MRIGMPACCAARTTSATLSAPPMLPGLMRTAATPCSIAFSARLALKWMSAITGIGEKRTMRPSASASSVFGTATRTTSHPADASAAIWAVVASTSCVFVSVIDWTTTGAPPPTVTSPTVICRSEAIPSPSLASAEPVDVVRKPDEHEHQEERDSDRGDALADIPADRTAAPALDDREQDVAAVERQERQEVQQCERQADEAEHEQIPREADGDHLLRDVHDPGRARDLLSPGVRHDARQERRSGTRRMTVVFEAAQHRTAGPVLRCVPGGLEAEREPVADFLRSDRAEHLGGLAAQHGDGGRLAARAANRLRHCVEVRRLTRVDGDDRVAGPQAHRLRRRAALDALDRRVDVTRRADHVRHERQRKRNEDVRRRSREDDGDPLRRALPPVRVVAETVAQLVDAALRRARRSRRQLGLRNRTLELGQVLARRRQIAGLERTLDARGLRE